MSDMGQQQSDMDLNGFRAAPFAALEEVSGRAVGKARASTLRASKLDVDALHLRIEALLDWSMLVAPARMPMRMPR
jgi:hypothetical protein